MSSGEMSGSEMSGDEKSLNRRTRRDYKKLLYSLIAPTHLQSFHSVMSYISLIIFIATKKSSVQGLQPSAIPLRSRERPLNEDNIVHWCTKWLIHIVFITKEDENLLFNLSWHQTLYTFYITTGSFVSSYLPPMSAPDLCKHAALWYRPDTTNYWLPQPQVPVASQHCGHFYVCPLFSLSVQYQQDRQKISSVILPKLKPYDLSQ